MAQAMNISDKGIEHLKRWEGLRLTAYKDIAGICTIGYGHTGTAYEGRTITEGEAEQLLRGDLDWAEKAVNDDVLVPLSQNQFDALVSFVYNVGAGAFRRSTLLRRLNEGDYDEVPPQLMRWTRAGGKVSRGLYNRRKAEADLWIGDEDGI